MLRLVLAPSPLAAVSVVSVVSLVLVAGCATSATKELAPLEPLAVQAEPAPAPGVLVENHFARDQIGTLSEVQLREILQAPVFLEDKARVGVVPVDDGYGANDELPLVDVPGSLGKALDDTGLFDMVSEVSTDFPATGTVAGLRELAARYRCDYLVLYRHRFVDNMFGNGWTWAYATVIGPLFLPVDRLVAEGVLEATLFDVKTGTILFTTFERVKGQTDENITEQERKQKELKEKLLAEATKQIAKDVVAQVQRLAAARPDSAAAKVARAVHDAEQPAHDGPNDGAPTPLVE